MPIISYSEGSNHCNPTYVPGNFLEIIGTPPASARTPWDDNFKIGDILMVTKNDNGNQRIVNTRTYLISLCRRFRPGTTNADSIRYRRLTHPVSVVFGSQ